jgi:hypothetical protein
MQQDATNVNQCEPCPTNARNETLMVLDDKNPEAASIFKINCPYYAGMMLVYRMVLMPVF